MAIVYQLEAIDKEGKVVLRAQEKSIYPGFKTKDLIEKNDFDLFFLMLESLGITVNAIKIIRINKAFLYRALIVKEDGSKYERAIPQQLAYSFLGYNNVPLYIEAELFDALAKN